MIRQGIDRSLRLGLTATTTTTTTTIAATIPLVRTAMTSVGSEPLPIDSAKYPVGAAITAKLQAAFEPTHLQVINESHMHKVPRDSETHFKVVVVSSLFQETKSLIERHRLVNSALQAELNGPVHALSIVAKTPDQWQAMMERGETTIERSPKCRGGDGTLSRP